MLISRSFPQVNPALGQIISIFVYAGKIKKYSGNAGNI